MWHDSCRGKTMLAIYVPSCVGFLLAVCNSCAMWLSVLARFLQGETVGMILASANCVP